MSDFLHLIHDLGSDSWLKRKDASAALKEMAKENTAVLDELEKVLESDNEDVIFWALQTIGSLEGDQTIGILKRVAQKNKIVKSYVALALGDNPDPLSVDILLDFIDDSSWNVCNNAMTSLVKKKDVALENIVNSLKNAKYNKAYWLTKTLSRMGDKGVSVLAHFLKFKNKDVNVLVTEALGESNSEKAVDVLLECIVDDSHTVRLNAVDALIKFGPDVIEPMLNFLNKTNANINKEVEQVIFHLDSRKINVLIKLLKSENRNLKMVAAEFLGKTGSEYGVKALVNMLKDDYWMVRKSAAKGLVLVGEKCIPELIKALQTDDENTKYWVSNVLGKLGEPALSYLSDLLREDSKDLRMYSVMALGEFRNEKAILPLISALSDVAWPVRNTAADALKNFGGLALLHVLKSLLSQNDDIRFWSRKVFEYIAPKEIDRLIDLLTYDNDGELRYLVAYGLGLIGEEKAVPALINALLNDTNDWVRKYSATALGKIKTTNGIDALIKVLEDTNEELAYWVAKVLGQIGEDAVSQLQECLEHPEEKVRFFSIIALGSIGDEKSIKILMKVLAEDGESAKKAMDALAQSEKSIPYLVEALGNSNLNVRTNASKALIKLGEVAIEPLMEVVNSDNKEVHYWAAKSLREIQNKKK